MTLALCLAAYVLGVVTPRLWRLARRLATWLSLLPARVRDEIEYRRLEERALPDGTRVRLVCKCDRGSCREYKQHVWLTSWTPRRLGPKPWHRDLMADDYRLERPGSDDVTYATRGVLEVL